MHPSRVIRLDATVLDAAALLSLVLGRQPGVLPAAVGPSDGHPGTATAPIGLWRSADGAVQLRLAADGRYEQGVAGRRRRGRGTYQLDGTDLVLDDDSGLRTTAEVVAGHIEMAGHRLRPA